MANTTGGRSAIWVLRGNCMGAAALLLIEFGIGIGVNLYVTLPAHEAFFSTVFGQGAVATHAVIALALLGAAISALVRSIRLRRAVGWTALGLTAILVAAGAGAAFVGQQSVNSGDAGASLTMALATAVALFGYLMAVFTLAPA